MHFGLLTLLGLIFLFSGCSQQPEPLSHKVQCKSDIYAMKSAECIEKKSLVKKLEAYPVIFLGDHHDSKKVHAFTVELIDALEYNFPLLNKM